MLVDVLELVLHLDGEVDEVTQVAVLVALVLVGVDARRRHVRAADRLDLLDARELVVVEDLIEVDYVK